MKIGFDLDGVVYDFLSCFREYVMKVRPDLEVEDKGSTRWEFYEDWGLSLGEFLNLMRDAAEAGHLYTTQPPIEGIADVMYWCRNAGHSVHIITHRAEYGAKANTERWLAKWGVPHDTLTFSKDKHIVDADVLIEDRPENLIDWFSCTDKPGIIMEQPWNEEFRRYHSDTYRNRLYVARNATELRNILYNLSDAHLKAAEEKQARQEMEYMRAVVDGPESVLEEAQRLVHGDRGADYGHPIHDFSRTGRIWGAVLSKWAIETDGAEPVPPELVALCMVGVKMSREVNKAKRDNRVDIAGYTETLDMVRTYNGEDR